MRRLNSAGCGVFDLMTLQAWTQKHNSLQSAKGGDGGKGELTCITTERYAIPALQTRAARSTSVPTTAIAKANTPKSDGAHWGHGADRRCLKQTQHLTRHMALVLACIEPKTHSYCKNPGVTHGEQTPAHRSSGGIVASVHTIQRFTIVGLRRAMRLWKRSVAMRIGREIWPAS